MLRHLVEIHQSQAWTGELFAITADLGRIEWPGTLEHIQSLCTQLDIPLVVVRRQKGGMIDRWEQRRQSLISQQRNERNGDSAIASSSEEHKQGSKPFWSSSAARYCTKELKTAVVDRYLRRFKSVVCAVGIRAQESPGRAKKPHVQVRNDIITAALKSPKGLDAVQHEAWAEDAISHWLSSDCKGRLALSWNPILDWPIERVWQTLGCSSNGLERRRTLYQAGELAEALQGWPAHWAYVSGNSRLSCSLCVMASSADIYNGAQHNLATWLELASMETQSGWSFQQGKWLSDLSIDVESSVRSLHQLYAVLKQLGLVKQYGTLFAITLLTAMPTEAIALCSTNAILLLA